MDKGIADHYTVENESGDDVSRKIILIAFIGLVHFGGGVRGIFAMNIFSALNIFIRDFSFSL